VAYKYFEKSSIYHSDLRRATEDNSGISFMVTSDPKLSKNKTDHIFKIQPYGDDDDYWYQAENDQITAVLGGAPKNTWLIVKAHGDRDSAYLEITDVDGKPLTSLDAAVDAVAPTPPSPSAMTPTTPTPPAQDTAPAPPSTTAQPPAPPSTTENEPQVPAGIPQVQDKRERTDDLMLECLSRAHEIVSRFSELHDGPPSDLEQRVGVSLFINQS
jgi:hypothetical protein